MAKKKLTRKELLKDNDEFISLSSRAVIFVNQHSRQFIYLGLALVAVVIIYIGASIYMGHINKKGQELYNKAYYRLIKNMTPDADQKYLKQSAEIFQKVKNSYGISKAARLALPELAYLKFIEKKYEDAIPLYQDFLANVPDNMPYQSMARIALAACFEAEGDFSEAIQYLNQIIAETDGFFKEYAMFSLARVYRLAKQDEKSIEILKEFSEKFKSSPFLPLVKSHLKELP